MIKANGPAILYKGILKQISNKSFKKAPKCKCLSQNFNWQFYLISLNDAINLFIEKPRKEDTQYNAISFLCIETVAFIPSAHTPHSGSIEILS